MCSIEVAVKQYDEDTLSVVAKYAQIKKQILLT